MTRRLNFLIISDMLNCCVFLFTSKQVSYKLTPPSHIMVVALMENLQVPVYLVGDWTTCTVDKNKGCAWLKAGGSEFEFQSHLIVAV